MEPMQITILSVREQQGQLVTRARAEASQARIWLEIRFEADPSSPDIWEQARGEVLRYLDPA